MSHVVELRNGAVGLVGCEAARRAGVPAIVATIHVRLNTERVLLKRRRWKIVPLAAVLISFLATIYPSWQAAKTDPVEPLRYE